MHMVTDSPLLLKNVFGRNKTKLLTVNYVAMAVQQGCPPLPLPGLHGEFVFNESLELVCS